MNISRRKMISLIGGGTVLAASGAYLTTRTPTTALAPWKDAGTYPDKRRRALSYALLAPNPHNRQPWIAELTGHDGITLYRDASLNLAETDPFDRQLTVGMGCFIELLVQAAAQEGTAASVGLFPDGDAPTEPVAKITLNGSANPDPLFAQVMNRHTNRYAYDVTKPVKQSALDEILANVTPGLRAGGTVIEKTVAPLRDLTLSAMVLEVSTPHINQETIDLMRIGKSEIEANPDGISLGGPLLDTLGQFGILTRKAVADQESGTFSATLDMFAKTFAATPSFLWLVSPGNTRPDQIAAGRSWVRLHLAATALGMSMQPVSQSLQEYPEMSDHYAAIHGLLAQKGETVQMLGRLGFGPKQAPAPRWPLETRMQHA